jgi:aminopeptidase N
MASHAVKYRKDYRPTDFAVLSLEITFELDPEKTQVKTRLRLSPREATSLPLTLTLNGDSRVLTLNAIQKNGVPLSDSEYGINTEENTLSLKIEENDLSSPENTVDLWIHTEINPKANTALSGLYVSANVFCTQCEAEGFRRITYFLDRPDVMTLYTTKIIADQSSYPVLLSNGNLIEKGNLPGNRHYAIWEDPFKKPCYLFALVAGDLHALKDTFVTRSGRRVELALYLADKSKLIQCHHAMESLKHAMKWDEDHFDREYDLDTYMILAVDDFNMGAMENKGLNIFNTKYILAHEKTATDQDFSLVLTVVGHEYFHNWTGNRITCQDWFQLSLKEGLTVFRDQEFTADFYSRTLKRIEEVNIIRSLQFSEDKSPMAHPIRPDSYLEMNNFYTVTVYNKGAEVIRMQDTILGKAGFKKGMDLYFSRHDGQAVTCDDFIQCMEDANQADLSIFRRWYSQDGTPVVEGHGVFNEKTGTYELTFSQSCPPSLAQPQKLPFHIPITMALLDPDTQKETHAEVLHLTEESQTFYFKNQAKAPIPSLFRDFSAPIKLTFHYSLEDLLFLASHDPNEFNRWDAAQTLLKQKLLKDIKTPATDEESYEPYLRMLESILHSGCDQGLIAEAVSLPSERILAELMDGEIDPDGIHKARESFKKVIQQRFKTTWLSLYQRYHPTRDPSQRMLKNFALQQLMTSEEGALLAMKQLKEASDMTDQSAAFSALLQYEDPSIRQEASDFFYAQNRHEPLTLNKFFQLHAMNNHPSVLKTVAGLTEHPDFTLHNPNRVYALLVSFANNPAYFHDKEGLGYELMEAAIVKLNPVNPQVAAKLTKTLMNYKRFEPTCSAKMKAVLERLYQEKLCHDVYEIVEKALKNE